MTDSKFGIGLYFSIVASVISVIAAIAYATVMYKQTIVYVFLVATLVLAIGAAAMIKSGKGGIVTDYLPVVNAALDGLGAGFGVSLMVNQIGYVISGLDGMDTIITFIVFEVIALVAMVINIISAFMTQRVED